MEKDQDKEKELCGEDKRKKEIKGGLEGRRQEKKKGEKKGRGTLPLRIEPLSQPISNAQSML